MRQHEDKLVLDGRLNRLFELLLLVVAKNPAILRVKLQVLYIQAASLNAHCSFLY